MSFWKHLNHPWTIKPLLHLLPPYCTNMSSITSECCPYLWRESENNTWRCCMTAALQWSLGALSPPAGCPTVVLSAGPGTWGWGWRCYGWCSWPARLSPSVGSCRGRIARIMDCDRRGGAQTHYISITSHPAGIWTGGAVRRWNYRSAALEPAAPCDWLLFHHSVNKAIQFLHSLYSLYILYICSNIIQFVSICFYILTDWGLLVWLNEMIK